MRLAIHLLVAGQVCVALVLLTVSGLQQSDGIASAQSLTTNVQTASDKAASRAAANSEMSRPLPDITAILREVEIRQRAAEAVQKNYLYLSVETAQEVDSHGSVKKVTTKEYEDFCLSGVRVRRLMKKDGKSLSMEQAKKESDRIDKVAAKSRDKRSKAEAVGKETDPRGNEEIAASRFLELGRFTNARRVNLSGRDTIVVDYIGDPHAKTQNRSEDVIRDLVGTVWIDEQDLMIKRIEGHFVNSFKVGAGLLINIRKNTSFALEMRKVNDEVWLPARVNGHGAARVLLVFNFDGEVQIVYSNYRRFKTTSTIMPGLSRVEVLGGATETNPQ